MPFNRTYYSLILTLLVLVSSLLNAQSTSISISGVIADNDTKTPLQGVHITVKSTGFGTTTDSQGNFELRIPQTDSFTLIFQHIGYESFAKEVKTQGTVSHNLEVFLTKSLKVYDDIIITYSPTGSGVRYQPVVAYSGEYLDRNRNITLAQMLDGEPGIAMRSMGAAPSRPVIRGFDGERIIILENGERMGDISESAHDHAVTLDPQVVERVEVVRGPASLLYGSNALGGVVNMITSDIPNDWSRGHFGTASLQAASVNNLAGGYFKYGHGFENNALNFRVSHRTSGDYNAPGGRVFGTSMDITEGAAGWGFRHGNVAGGLTLMGMQSTYGIPENPDNSDELIEIRLNRLAAQARLDFETDAFFDKFQLRLHASNYNQDEVEILREPDGAKSEDVELYFNQRAISTSINMQHRSVGILDRGAVGINVIGRYFDVGGDEAFTPGDQFINMAIYTFQEIPISMQTRLQAGLRIDQRYLQTRANEANPDINARINNTNIAGSIGLNHRISKLAEFGLQFARAHRYPTVEELYANGAHLGAGTFEIGDPSLNSEIGYGTDAFIKYNTSSVFFELSLFYNYISNFIVFQPLGTTDTASGLPVFRYESDNARLFGGELAISYMFDENFRINAVADYVNGSRADTENTPLPVMPPFRIKTGFEYNFGAAWIGTDIRYVFSQNRVTTDEEPTDGYTLASLQGGYKFDSMGFHRMTLHAENLLNKSYKDHLSRIEDRANPMPGRNVTLVYSWNF